MHELTPGLSVDLDTMTLHVDLRRFQPEKRAVYLTFDLMPALEDAYCKYVLADEPESEDDEQGGGEEWNA